METLQRGLPMRILITGALGWTAQAIIQTLHHDGHALIGFDLPGATPSPAIEALLTQLIEGSVDDEGAVGEAMAGIDSVVHLAVAVGEDDYATSRIPFATNVWGTYNIFNVA